MIAVYNSTTNQVKTFIREDYGGYRPPEGYALVNFRDLPAGWTLEVDTSHEERLDELRQSAKAIFSRQEDAFKTALQAIVRLIVAELNILRERDRDRSADVAAATNLANLQTRWAARSSLNDRTGQQAKTAIESLIDEITGE